MCFLRWTCTNTCRNAPLVWADSSLCWIPGLFPHSCHLSGAYESRGSTSLESLLVLSGWQVNVNLNRWLLPPPTYIPLLFTLYANSPSGNTSTRTCLLPRSTSNPQKPAGLITKTLRRWRTKEGLQRTEGRVDEGDHWMTKFRKVRSPHLVRLEFITPDFKTPP